MAQLHGRLTSSKNQRDFWYWKTSFLDWWIFTIITQASSPPKKQSILKLRLY